MVETTSATLAANNTDYGIDHFWAQGDAITHTVALILLVMSILSWTQIAIKTWRARERDKRTQALEQFWQAPTLEEATAKLTETYDDSAIADLSRQALSAAHHYDTYSAGTIGGATDRSEFITRALRQCIAKNAALLESGLTLLASIGSVAPFVGLFGTVWGIYHALLSIASTGSASIDKISGPVGEALIMTAAGLFVAIPAVLAYNAFTRMNRLELSELDGFAHDLLAYLNTGSRVQQRTPIHVVKGAN